jgi:hypothetical protein
MVDQWLVRTANNWIAGPYSVDQVCQMVRDGKLVLQDEICLANKYWVYLHEREEVKQLLGIEVPKAHPGSDDEVTETEMVMEDGPTDPGIPMPAEESLTENTAVIHTAALKGLKSNSSSPPKKSTHSKAHSGSQHRSTRSSASSGVGVSNHRLVASSQSFHQVEIMGQMEKPSFWRGLAWVLVASSAVLIGGMVWLLRR